MKVLLFGKMSFTVLILNTLIEYDILLVQLVLHSLFNQFRMEKRNFSCCLLVLVETFCLC